MLKRPLALFLFLFVLGEIIVRLLISNILWIIPVTLTAGLIIRRGRKYMTGEIRVIYFLLFFGLLLGAGHGTLYSILRVREVKHLKSLCNTEILCRGEVLSLKEGGGYKSYVIKTKEGKVIFYLSETNKYSKETEGRNYETNNTGERGDPLPGDFVILKGELKEIKKSTNPGSFDSNSYYKNKGIDYLLDGKISEIRRRNSLKKYLYRLKIDMKEAFYLVLPPKQAGLLSSMLLGDKEGIDREDYIIYQMNGMAHMLAISGLHVSLVAEAFFFFFMIICRRRRAAAGLTIIFIILYGSITGFAEATSRAVIMMTVIMAGRVFSSAADSVTSLFLALFINIIINPYAISSSGFIMSYLAVAGVLISQVFYKQIFKNERFLMVPLWLRKYLKYMIKALLMGIILNAIMLPVMLNNYYGIPVFSLLVNMLLVPLLCIALISGFLGGGIVCALEKGVACALGNDTTYALGKGVAGSGFGWIREIGTIVALPAKWVLKLYEAVGRFMLKLPGSYITTGHIGTVGIVLICLIFFIITAFIYHRLSRGSGKNKRRKYIVTLSVYILMMTISVATVKIINQCREYTVFLDVGQGDCCILHTRNSGNYIFDSGSSSVDEVGYRTLIPALKYYGMDKIDVIFVSHTDSDHVNGIIELISLSDIEKIKIKNIAFAKGTVEDENMKAILNEADKKRKKDDLMILYLSAGDEIKKGSVHINILYPYYDEPKGEALKEKSFQGKAGSLYEDKNDYSMVADLKYKKVEILFTGDVSSKAEEKIEYFSLNKKEEARSKEKDGGDTKESGVIKILKVPHHGSKTSSSEAFLEKVDCDIAVISVGENNFYGHPARETLERLDKAGCKIYRTDKDGAVIIEE